MRILSGVRGRLTLWYAGTVLVVLLGWAVGIYITLRHALHSELDDRLREDVELVEELMEEDGTGSVTLKASGHLRGIFDQRQGLIVEVVDDAGKRLAGWGGRGAAPLGAVPCPSGLT